MASQPPTRTLTHDLIVGALPSIAPNKPKTPKEKLTAPKTTPNLTSYSFIKDAACSGTIAPTENANAEVAAACKGFG
ncbi:hypothetical protein Lalb_Chr02g0141401 [Lupinus albus]|uniref:Uncharacterized protein n=1 Tax=Lupinus albus TaxID=3870 RepID=A0A6A4QTZ9_LUPAL|nr:hypothetical protein Lalb_Chr02g0141401 [Lupinus albus]